MLGALGALGCNCTVHDFSALFLHPSSLPLPPLSLSLLLNFCSYGSHPGALSHQNCGTNRTGVIAVITVKGVIGGRVIG